MQNPTYESKRLQALLSLDILDSPYEEEFSNIVELASKICDTPVSLISLIAEKRQWFKAKKGVPVTETCRSVSFCEHALYQTDLLVVNDATKDERFANNPMVTGEPFVRFYAGSQIYSPDGYALGTLCVIDRQAKELSWQQASTLKLLSQQVTRLIQLRYRDIEATRLEKKIGNQQTQIEALHQKIQNSNNVTRTNNGLLYDFLLQQSAPLKTGKFTKKSITAIGDELEHQAARLQLFIITQKFLSSNETAGKDFETVNLSQAVETALMDFSVPIKESSLKIITSVAATATIFQKTEAVLLLLKLSLHVVLVNMASKRVDIIVAQHNLSTEIRISVTDDALRTALASLLIDTAEEQDNFLAFEIGLLKQVVETCKGSFQIIQLGENGVALSVALSNAQV